MDTLKPRLGDLELWWALFQPLRALSPLFGRLCGDLRLHRRRGRVADDREALVRIAQTLQPLDILLERSRFRLTDRVIPGFFNHAALYLGRREDWGPGLPAAPRWPDTACVLEAVRSGVRLLPLADFLDVDDLAVLRDTALDGEARPRLLARALGQVGKGYDYAFDIADGRRQFCSKLVADVFAHRRFGDGAARPPPTLLPDHLATAALAAGSTLAPVYFSPCREAQTPAALRGALGAVLA